MITPRADGPRPATILIVDDERNNRALLEVMLTPEGFTLITAASGEEALAAVVAQPPDLILLDVMMPGMGGFQVAAIIKGNLATRGIPVIMVTALDDHQAKVFGLEAGAEEFLTKPVDRVELCTRVRNLLRLKASADAALAQRDACMGMVSHDLRNLLNSVVLNATALVDGLVDSPEGRRTIERVARIRRSVDRMDRLVGDLVDVVSLDAGKLAMWLAPGDVVALMRETVETCAAAAAAKDITLTVAAAEPRLEARCDRGRMLQVLTNVVGNAVKFTPPGGTVVLAGRHAGDELALAVSDTGAGIPPDMLEAMFDRFAQGADGDHERPRAAGLGLGLYISRCIVESHGGRIWAERREDVGSTIHVTIPRTPPRTVAAIA